MVQGIFNARLWKKKEVALITILRIFSTCIISRFVHGCDVRIAPTIPTPHKSKKKRDEESLNRFENKCLTWSIESRRTQGTRNHRDG